MKENELRKQKIECRKTWPSELKILTTYTLFWWWKREREIVNYALWSKLWCSHKRNIDKHIHRCRLPTTNIAFDLLLSLSCSTWSRLLMTYWNSIAWHFFFVSFNFNFWQIIASVRFVFLIEWPVKLLHTKSIKIQQNLGFNKFLFVWLFSV